MSTESGHILVVDDNRMNRIKLSRSLEHQGYVVGLAEGGQQALDMLAGQRFDVVLLDIIMPGLSGPETLEQILAIDPTAKVIMVSSLGTEEAVEQCLALGAKSFLQKPFSKEGLIEFLRRVFEAPEEPALS